jgi:putative ABC transport system ATP-binding protein
MSEGLLATRGLRRHFHRAGHVIRAVDGISLKIDRGDFLAVVGASGSGKSTLLNLLAGLDTPTAGRVEFGGRSLADLSRRELAAYRARRVGMVFQSFNLLPHLTALQNVALALYFGDCLPRERQSRAAGILTQLGLADRLEHRPLDLSGGEQQRVAIARALVKDPEILFADEPTGNLDAENAAAIASILTQCHQRGLTVVLVTHDPSLARRAAGRLVCMHYGKLMSGSHTENEDGGDESGPAGEPRGAPHEPA